MTTAELRTLDRDKDWTVQGTSIAGAGKSAAAELKGLQADLNRFAGLAQVEAVVVDGYVGPKTVASVKAVYDAVVAKNPLLTATPFPVPDSKEEVATYAPHIRQWLAGTAADALGAARQRRLLFGAGKEWNVKDDIAYGAGAVHEEYKALQADLNRFAASAGFAALGTDGFIGPKTASAVTAIYKQVVAKNPLLAATPFPVPDTKEEVAEWAQHIRAWLSGPAAGALGVHVGS
jgi:uncharacterized protein (DUF2236 family)